MTQWWKKLCDGTILEKTSQSVVYKHQFILFLHTHIHLGTIFIYVQFNTPQYTRSSTQAFTSLCCTRHTQWKRRNLRRMVKDGWLVFLSHTNNIKRAYKLPSQRQQWLFIGFVWVFFVLDRKKHKSCSSHWKQLLATDRIDAFNTFYSIFCAAGASVVVVEATNAFLPSQYLISRASA